jgi:hypothetical protein
MEYNKLHLDCDCETLEHSLRFSYDTDFDCVIVDTHLIKKPVLTRIIYAIKYVFGYTSMYGAFEETLLSHESVSELQSFLSKFQKETENG